MAGTGDLWAGVRRLAVSVFFVCGWFCVTERGVGLLELKYLKTEEKKRDKWFNVSKWVC